MARNFSIRLSDEVDQALRAFADDYDTPVSQVVERALRVYLTEKAGVEIVSQRRPIP
jgi:predicted transcriptional regulator